MTAYTVEFVVPADADLSAAGETVTLTVDEDRYLLAAARDAGLWLPADCQQGWCTTCAARLLVGTVDQDDARRYYAVDEAADLILPCTAKPRSDLRLQVCQERAMLEHRAANSLPPGDAKL